jgi:hypothetical protein
MSLAELVVNRVDVKDMAGLFPLLRHGFLFPN